MTKHIDKIIKDLELSYQGVFDFKQLVAMLKQFFKRYNYDITEKAYEEKPKGDLKNTVIKWDTDRKLDDYNKAVVKVEMNLSDYKEGYVDGSKIVDGNFKFKINAEMERDYDDKWQKSAYKKFFRAVYEKFVTGEKQKSVDNSVKDLVENLKKEVKQYLKI